MITRIKICCIKNMKEAEMAISFGASAIGLVAKMPSGPGPIPDETIREIAAAIPPPVATFMLTSHTSVADIIDHHKRTNTNTIQIVDSLAIGTYRQLKEALPAVRIVQVIHVIDENSIEEAIGISRSVDAILLDSGKSGGGHGTSLDQADLQRLKCPHPWYLAGGLGPHNLTAMKFTGASGFDLNSGVESLPGIKDHDKVRSSFNILRGKP